MVDFLEKISRKCGELPGFSFEAPQNRKKASFVDFMEILTYFLNENM